MKSYMIAFHKNVALNFCGPLPGITSLTFVPAFDRTPVSGGVCHGGHWPCWNMSGDSGQRWSFVSSGETQHPQTARWGFLLWENLQAQWVSELSNRRTLQQLLYLHSYHKKKSCLPFSLICLWFKMFGIFFSDLACSVAGITSDANVLTNELRLIAQRWVFKQEK